MPAPTTASIEQLQLEISARGEALRSAPEGNASERLGRARRLQEKLVEAASIISRYYQPGAVATPPAGVSSQVWLGLIRSYETQSYSYRQETSQPTTTAVLPVVVPTPGGPGEEDDDAGKDNEGLSAGSIALAIGGTAVAGAFIYSLIKWRQAAVRRRTEGVQS